MIRRPPRSTLDRSSAASDVYKRQPRLGTDRPHLPLLPAPTHRWSHRRVGEVTASFDPALPVTGPVSGPATGPVTGPVTGLMSTAAIGLNRPHHDGSALYVSTETPRLGEVVSLWLRVPAGATAPGEAPFDAAYVRVLRCLLYTSDAADERSRVDLGGRRIIKKKKSM